MATAYYFIGGISGQPSEAFRPSQMSPDEDGQAIGLIATFVVIVNNQDPLPPDDGTIELQLFPSGAIAAGTDGSGDIGILKTFVGCGPLGTGPADGIHYNLSGFGMLTFTDGFWEQQFRGDINYDSGTLLTFNIQTVGSFGTSVDPDIPPVDSPPDSTIIAPTLMTAAFAGGDHVHLTWQDNSDNELGFMVLRSDDAEATWLYIASVPAGFEAFNDYGVSSGSHSYKAWAFKADKISIDSNIATVEDEALSIISVTPNTGGTLGADPVTIVGTGFLSGITVEFDGTPATSVVIVDTEHLTCVTPAHAVGAVDVVVENTDTSTDTLVDGYAYSADRSAPVVNAGNAQRMVGPLPSVVTTAPTVTRGNNNGTLSYAWTQESGPETLDIDAPTAAVTAITATVYSPGTYVFRLTVTTEDLDGMTISAYGDLAVVIGTLRAPIVTVEGS